MPKMQTVAEAYFADGCGRCELFKSPECKVHRWSSELGELRTILARCDLVEECKWGHPCYTNGGQNVVLIGAFKEYVCLSFFRGALLDDPASLLVQQTEHVQSGRQLRFTKRSEIVKLKATILAYVKEAIAITQRGETVARKTTEEFAVPDELTQALKNDSKFARAFHALTPGRQRGYLLHFAGAKQSSTRAARVEKAKARIFQGLGLHDR